MIKLVELGTKIPLKFPEDQSMEMTSEDRLTAVQLLGLIHAMEIHGPDLETIQAALISAASLPLEALKEAVPEGFLAVTSIIEVLARMLRGKSIDLHIIVARFIPSHQIPMIHAYLVEVMGDGAPSRETLLQGIDGDVVIGTAPVGLATGICTELTESFDPESCGFWPVESVPERFRGMVS